MKREYKYYPEDFGNLTVKVLHYDLLFEIFDEHMKTVSDLKLKTLDKPITEIDLDAKALELLKLTCGSCPITFDYDDKVKHKIHIHFSKPIPQNTEFTLHSETIMKPTNHILEGLYFDTTPKNAPPTMVTQCHEGFERLTPCVYEFTAKASYRTTIIADKRYTHMISNGDVELPRKKYDDKRDTITYNNSKVTMAPYLFFLGVGTYASFQRELEYPEGDKILLEILVLPDSDKEAGKNAVDILYDAVMWTYLFTGPKKYEQVEVKKKIWELIKQRDRLKENGKEKENSVKINALREEIKKLTKPLVLGYKYTAKVYREIAAYNFQHGGMENVGNTVITGNAILPTKEVTDGRFEWLIEVKLHEFYHNINGSEVTMKTPFDFWLNEAATEFIQEEYAAELNGESYQRLGRVISLIAPGGVFEEDSGAKSMPIEPDGFNEQNELVSSIVYVKAPEFVRMLMKLIGKSNYMKGLWLYYDRFMYGNASRADWVKAMEDASGVKLSSFANTWLKNTGYPIVEATTKYENKKYSIHLKQSGFKDGRNWEFPFDVAIFDSEGKKLAHKLERITSVEQTITFDNVPKPAFVSLNREYSFYGKVIHKATEEELILQAAKDDDMINRYMAFYQLADIEKMRLLKDKKAKPSDRFIQLYHSIFTDRKLLDEMSSLMIALTQGVEDDSYSHKYQDVYEAREKIFKEIATRYKGELIKLYKEYDVVKTDGTYVENQVFNIKKRGVKNSCLGILSKLDTEDIHKMIKKQYDNANNATDKAIAFSCYIKSSAKDRLDVLKHREEEASKNPITYEVMLSGLASNEADDIVDILKKVVSSKHYNINMSNHQRALYEVYADHKRISLLTEKGREFLKEGMIKLAKLNEYNTGRCLDAFGKIDFLDEKPQVECVKLLLDVLTTVDQDSTPSVYNTIKRILNNSPDAVASYEKVHGKIKI